jgi:hypothetical protein
MLLFIILLVMIAEKTIPIINNNGFVVMPHYLTNDYNHILNIVKHCEDNLTLLRYLDLNECSKFILYVEQNNFIKSNAKYNRTFASINDITMTSIKTHYLKVLKNIKDKQLWDNIYSNLLFNRKQFISLREYTDNNYLTRSNSDTTAYSHSHSQAGQQITKTNSVQQTNNTSSSGNFGIYITTKDAYTLTDGPTIFLANNVSKIANFCIQQANIPSSVMQDIMDKIDFNNQINLKISEIEIELENEEEKLSKEDTNKKTKDNLVNKTQDKSIARLRDQINMLRSMIKNVSINELFVPNKISHIKKWAENYNLDNSNSKPFTSNIDENIVCEIMSLNDVEDSWKVLLLLGIGVFTQHKSQAYTEIMKKLADTQRLYLIIANSDYIYGTNYQFCHGYISKDLELTQEKIIQALGRIGRNNIQQEYSARFRDDLHNDDITKYGSILEAGRLSSKYPFFSSYVSFPILIDVLRVPIP